MAHSLRRRTRVSRPLIAVLGLTMAVGGLAYVHNLKNSLAHYSGISLKAVAPTVPDSKGKPRLGATESSAIASPTTTAGSISPPPATRPAVNAAMPAPLVPVPSPAIPASATILSSTPLPDAKAKLDAGDLLAARSILNDALLAGHLTSADAESARHQLSQISQAVFFSVKRFKDDPFQTVRQVQSGERLSRIADRSNVTWELLCRMNGLADARKLRAGQWIKIPNGPFHCVITKSLYRLDVYLNSPGEAGSLFVTSFPVGLGKDNSTPTGLWILQQGSKAHPATYYSPRGEGVFAANDPKNPLGGYWMGLSGISGNALEKSSYGIHGTIEPDSIGKQASMGCIRLGHEDIALLYDLLVDGKSKVVVKD